MAHQWQPPMTGTIILIWLMEKPPLIGCVYIIYTYTIYIVCIYIHTIYIYNVCMYVYVYRYIIVVTKCDFTWPRLRKQGAKHYTPNFRHTAVCSFSLESGEDRSPVGQASCGGRSSCINGFRESWTPLIFASDIEVSWTISTIPSSSYALIIRHLCWCHTVLHDWDDLGPHSIWMISILRQCTIEIHRIYPIEFYQSSPHISPLQLAIFFGFLWPKKNRRNTGDPGQAFGGRDPGVGGVVLPGSWSLGKGWNMGITWEKHGDYPLVN